MGCLSTSFCHAREEKKLILISVNSGEEVMEVVTKQLSERGVTSAAIVSVIGATDECCISNMPAGDAKSDVLTEYQQPFEMSGTGEVKNGIPHIHCTLGSPGDVALSGHLHWAKVKDWFVNVYLMPLTD
jgi:predicted DNA-binding protein with PD1-like motif